MKTTRILKNIIENKYTIKCHSCQTHEDWKIIHKGAYGQLVLRVDDQGPLGRAIYSPYKHISNLNDLINYNRHVIDEKYEILLGYEKALKELWNCYKIADLQIGNLTRDENGNVTLDKNYDHIHWHFIPSYSKPILFNNRVFIDHNFSQALNIDEKRGYIKTQVSKEEAISIINQINLHFPYPKNDKIKKDIFSKL